VTTLDMGRTFTLPILKLGVSCIAAISKENVSCTDVCIVAVGCALVIGAGGCLVIGATGGLVTGAGGVWVGSSMVAGVVVCGNSRSAEIAACVSVAGAVTGSATGDFAEVTASSCDREYSCRIGSISGSGEVRVATLGRTSPFATVGI